jgi:hypothetical protein
MSIHDLIKQMTELGWLPGSGATESDIVIAEMELNVMFPEDYKHFLMRTGGSPAKVPWKGLWTLNELVSLNKTMPIFKWFGGLVGIGNESFIVYAFDYRNGKRPGVVSLGLSSSDWNDVLLEAGSFTDWLKATIPRGKR